MASERGANHCRCVQRPARIVSNRLDFTPKLHPAISLCLLPRRPSPDALDPQKRDAVVTAVEQHKICAPSRPAWRNVFDDLDRPPSGSSGEQEVQNQSAERTRAPHDQVLAATTCEPERDCDDQAVSPPAHHRSAWHWRARVRPAPASETGKSGPCALPGMKSAGD